MGDFSSHDSWLLPRVAVAILAGSVPGLERQLGKHEAGLVHMLIAAAPGA